MTPRALPLLFGAICLGAAVRASWRWDTDVESGITPGKHVVVLGDGELIAGRDKVIAHIDSICSQARRP
ncbi:hypothetical protein ACWGE0_12540 [Lentzea sp. NPDC054927]